MNWDTVGTSAADGTPTQIDEHTCCKMDNKVVVFGGFNDGERTNDVHIFDTDACQWTKRSPVDANAPAPKPRAGHSATLHEGILYIFGGKDDENLKLNDIWKFDIEQREWTELEPSNSQQAPTQRAGHSALLYQGYICIFGGIFEVTKELNDFHLYDIENNRWICLFSEKVEPVSA